MNTSYMINIIRDSLVLLLMLSGFIIIPQFLASIIISIFQATTQIQEQSLTFVPKIFITILILLLGAPYFLNTLSGNFMHMLNIFSNIK